MKIGLLVIGGIVVLVAGILVIGLLLPQHHVASRSAFYAAPAAQLFALIAGPQNRHGQRESPVGA
jgi:hypothetical protein